MSNYVRERGLLDDRHNIGDPFGPGAKDIEKLANTLCKTRIPDLFRTAPGLPGHVRQIQQELNRLRRIEGESGEKVARAIEASKLIRGALKKAKAATATPCPWQLRHSLSSSERHDENLTKEGPRAPLFLLHHEAGIRGDLPLSGDRLSGKKQLPYHMLEREIESECFLFMTEIDKHA